FVTAPCLMAFICAILDNLPQVQWLCQEKIKQKTRPKSQELVKFEKEISQPQPLFSLKARGRFIPPGRRLILTSKA
ncbi:MAG: hypothetical protein SV487_04015, partial [Thermodesulfobacteriota bacterium]|nr:hypothetical protein [Thermodesulfobacteriota bacterium]